MTPWLEIYSQTRPSTDFESCTLDNCNIFIDNQNFMNFDQIRNLQSYRFKLEWEGGESIEWTQTDNPLSVTNKNMNVCANNGCRVSAGMPDLRFEGLSLSSAPWFTLLDGIASEGWWYYSVGYKIHHSGGAPSYLSWDGIEGIKMRTKLYIAGKASNSNNSYQKLTVFCV